MRVNLTLKCTVCGEENYISKKNKRNNPERLEMNKYCPRCKKATAPREKKYGIHPFYKILFKQDFFLQLS